MDTIKARRVRRATSRIVIALLLGVITTVPAMYAAAMLDRREFRGSTPNSRRFDVVAAAEVVGHGYQLRSYTIVNIGRLNVMPPSHRGCAACPSWATSAPPHGFTAVTTAAGGWPFRWLRSEYWVDHNVNPPRLQRCGWYYTVIPLPFAANTAIFAAIWGSSFVTIARTRRWWRERSHCCPECAYSLAGLVEPGCPECGWLRAAPGPGVGRTA